MRRGWNQSQIIYDKGGRLVGLFLILSDSGGGGGKGVRTPLFLDDIICEQPLIPYTVNYGETIFL